MSHRPSIVGGERLSLGSLSVTNFEGRTDMSGFRAIVLMAVDDTEPSEYAFSWYRDYVHKPDFFVVLLHCTDHDDHEFGEASPAKTAKMIKDMSDRMRSIEEKFGHLMQISGITGRIRKGKGKPGEAIIKAANDEGASMIVCGTRGLGKIKRAFLGSVSDYVAHHSSVPVIICRRQ